ncbi:MAG: helix-turn-helix domain-containing protein [bacterium]|nr:helix-turn-helix domain-containing protein [bacterium]
MTSLRELGAELKVAREASEISLETLATDLRIRLAHLQAIEAGNESALPEPIYVKIFIRKYAQAVGLDGEMLAAAYWALHAAPPPAAEERQVQLSWWVLPWIVGAVLVSGVVTLSIVERRVPPPPASPTPDLVTTSPAPMALPGTLADPASLSLEASGAFAPAEATGSLAGATVSTSIPTTNSLATGSPEGRASASLGLPPLQPGDTPAPATTGLATVSAPTGGQVPRIEQKTRPLIRKVRARPRTKPSAVSPRVPARANPVAPAKVSPAPVPPPAPADTPAPLPPDDIEIPE